MLPMTPHMPDVRDDVRREVAGWIAQGMRHTDASSELANIHACEAEEEASVFADFDRHFHDTRHELLEGVFNHLLEDTVKAMNEVEAMA